MRKVIFLFLMTLSISCSNLEESKIIGNVDSTIVSRQSGMVSSQEEEWISLSSLSNDCDLSLYNLESPSNLTSFVYDVNVPNLNYPPPQFTWAELWGEFPSDNISKELTYILWGQRYSGNFNGGLLPVITPESTINPNTGQPYYMTVVNQYFNVYYLSDSFIQVTPDSWEYEFLDEDIPLEDAIILRDKIACLLVEEASELDPTTFIADILISGDGVLYNPYTCTICLDSHMLTIWVKWGHHV